MTSKKDLPEQDIWSKYITPAILGAGWDLHTQIREQVYIANGRVQVRGKLATRGKRKFADYIPYRDETPLAVIEAKDNSHAVGASMQQALDYLHDLTSWRLVGVRPGNRGRRP
jgi:type I restriction enzyme R subunit